MKTVTALFDDYQDAAATVRELEAAGFRVEEISLIVSTYEDEVGETYVEDRAADGAGAGAGIGALLGGTGGLLAGLGALAIPGIGPVVAAGWLVSAAVGASPAPRSEAPPVALSAPSPAPASTSRMPMSLPKACAAAAASSRCAPKTSAPALPRRSLRAPTRSTSPSGAFATSRKAGMALTPSRPPMTARACATASTSCPAHTDFCNFCSAQTVAARARLR